MLPEAPVFKYAAALLLLLWPASAEVHLDYTFSHWEKLQDDDRAACIARFIDTLAVAAGTARHVGRSTRLDLRVHLARRRRRLVKQIADDAFLHKAAVAHELPFSTSRSTDAPNVLPPELSAIRRMSSGMPFVLHLFSFAPEHSTGWLR
jgi:hypothetical protein